MSLLLKIAVILSIIKLTLPLPFIPNLSILWLGGVIICLSWALFKDKKLQVSIPLLLFCLVVLVGLFIKQPPIYYRSLERFILFVINISFLSSLITSPTLIEIRKHMLYITLIGVRVIVVASFIAYFLGINLAVKNISIDYRWAFAGITSQSMILAPCCGICLIETLWKMLYGDFSKKQLLIQCGLLIMTIWTILVAGSRGSLIASALSIAVLFYYYPFKKRLLKYVTLISIPLTFLVPSYIYENATYTINKKMISANNHNSLTSSRDEKWEARLMEFKENPILGVGFASQTHFTSDDNMQWIEKTGSLESGSSWLSILSMTGILGFIIIAIFNIKMLSCLVKAIKRTPFYILHLCLLIFLLTHGIIEAWVLYSGGFIFYLYWLLTGNLSVNSIDNHKTYIDEYSLENSNR